MIVRNLEMDEKRARYSEFAIRFLIRLASLLKHCLMLDQISTNQFDATCMICPAKSGLCPVVSDN